MKLRLEGFTEEHDSTFELKVDLFKSWKEWAEAGGEVIRNQRWLTECLQSRGFEPSRQGHTGRRGFKGIRIKRPDCTDDPRYGLGEHHGHLRNTRGMVASRYREI